MFKHCLEIERKSEYCPLIIEYSINNGTYGGDTL